MTRALPLVALVIVLAGCASPAATPPGASSPALTVASDRPDTSFGDITTGPAVGPDENATTAAAPRLVAGEWWRIQFSGGFLQGAPELVRVVAKADADGYVVGMPHEGWFKEAIVFHAPSFGDVGMDLSYDVHNARFHPLRFPLVAGATWKTPFGGSNYTATVERADATTATIRYEPPQGDPSPTDTAMGALMKLSPLDASGAMRMTYDARQHEIVQFESAFGTWKVVAHGYGYEGWVTVPRGEHTAIDHGQLGPATPGGDVVRTTVAVDNGFNRMTIIQAIVPFGPGAYRIRDISPNGTEYVDEAMPGSKLTIQFHEATKPGGTWTLEDVVAGPGVTFTMGMAYHQYDVRLPDGAIRTDHAHPVIR